jgi:recombination associated protein RdgC
MWFNNALIYQYELDNASNLNDLLSEEMLKPCPPHARFIFGWSTVIANAFIHEIAGCSLICMGKEERILPRGVITRLLIEKIQAIETLQNRTVKRAERAQIAEDLEFELLPKSFCVQKKLYAILDTVSKRLIINTASETQASQLTALLRKTVAGIHIQPLPLTDHLALKFTDWIINPHTLPANFQLASDCVLFSRSDEKKRVNCKGYELPAEEISTLLTQGLDVAEICLVWHERIQFTLTQDFTIKRIKTLDYLVDEFAEIKQLEDEYQQQDAALTLLSGELRGLTNELLASLNPVKVNSLSEILQTALINV